MNKNNPFYKLFNHLLVYFFSLDRKLRFLLVGGYNTALGFALFAILIFAFSDKNYLIISVITHFLSVINSFFTLKIFVFRTKGNYKQEFIKTNITYLFVLFANLILLYIFTDILGFYVLVSQLFCIIIVTIFSYLMHLNFSFKQKEENNP